MIGNIKSNSLNEVEYNIIFIIVKHAQIEFYTNATLCST